MTRDRRLLLLLMLLMACGLLAEARHREHEEDADPRHRHRHGHSESSARRASEQRELLDALRLLSPAPKHLADASAYRDDDEEFRDQWGCHAFDFLHPGFHGLTLDQRYPAWYHRGHRVEDDDRRGRRVRKKDKTRHKLDHSRNRDSSDYEDDEDDLERSRSYESQDDGRAWRRNGRSRRIGSRRDRRLDAKRHRADEARKLDEWRRRTESSGGRRKIEDSEDYDDRAEDWDEQEEEEDGWRETEDENQTEEDDEFDNDFYKNERKAPLKTYDDIIRRLTSDDPTTPKSSVKRDYRNAGIEKYAKRDAFAYLRMEPRNLSRVMIQGKADSLHHADAARRTLNASKQVDSQVDRKSARNASAVAARSVDRQEKKARSKTDDTQAKTKSLEQDYDEYLNSPDTEKEEDLMKAGVEEESGMQADVTNTDYTEDEDEGETPAAFPSSTTTTTTTSTTTTTTTTTTPRPPPTQNYDYRDPRGYESGTGTQYNGYQGKNDYPPMSAHSVHKWQSLGTRESVKETRGNMQQYNKNGKTAEIREALQHAIKVSREGSCQVPRPRVIPVRDVYPSPSTTYIPHCAILHRCSDDTGCCRSEALTCVPKHSHRVELSFYMMNVGGGSTVEKLSFYNHTECECRERSEYETGNEKPFEQRVYRHYQPSQQPQNMRVAQPRKPCRCPSEFMPRITHEGECQCNCYENHQNCIKIRRGKGYFSLADRLCIQNEECAMPSCEFGEYMRRQGKCPRKKDKFDAIVSHRTSLSHRYRS